MPVPPPKISLSRRGGWQTQSPYGLHPVRMFALVEGLNRLTRSKFVTDTGFGKRKILEN